MKRITIIDANNFGHRAFHTVGDLSYKGISTGVIFGVLSQLFYACAAVKTDTVIFCWDSTKSKRRDRFPFYKNRPERSPEEKELMKGVFHQFDLLRKNVLPQIGFVNNFQQTGYEADDLIAETVLHDPDNFYTICSGDEDLYQLLSRNCQIHSTRKKGVYTKADFMREYKIHPEKWIEVKKLAGCTSDTIPGIRGIGEKRAISYLTKKLPSKSAFYQKILREKHIVQEHDWLIRLPLPGTKIPKIEDSVFNKTEFKYVCEYFGLSKFSPKEWELVFWNNALKEKDETTQI